MKIKELIKELDKYLDAYGDIEVQVKSGPYENSFGNAYYDFEPIRSIRLEESSYEKHLELDC